MRLSGAICEQNKNPGTANFKLKKNVGLVSASSFYLFIYFVFFYFHHFYYMHF